MALSRNIYAKSILSNDLRKRYRSSSQPKTNSDKQTILNNISKDKIIISRSNRELGNSDKQTILNNISKDKINISRSNRELEKQEILRNFDPNKIDELRKRQKFSPYDNIFTPEPEPEFGICELFDTGFEDDCDYYGELYLIGDYIILENFETRSNDDIGGEIFNVSTFKYTETFEGVVISGEMINFKINPPTSETL